MSDDLNDGEDVTLICPEDAESATGHFDPAGYHEDDCAGCGCRKSEHKRRACERCGSTIGEMSLIGGTSPIWMCPECVADVNKVWG